MGYMNDTPPFLVYTATAWAEDVLLAPEYDDPAVFLELLESDELTIEEQCLFLEDLITRSH